MDAARPPLWQRTALALTSVVVLAIAAWTVWQFEATLRSGQTVLLQLAPVDPRSIMQGDYMTLRYALEDELQGHLHTHATGKTMPDYAYLRLDEARRASWAGAGPRADAPAGTVALRIRPATDGAHLGPNAFFFQEGTADAYAAAQWGEFRVAPDGKALLVALRDAELKPLGFNRF